MDESTKMDVSLEQDGLRVSSEVLDKMTGKKAKNSANDKTTRMKADASGEYSVVRNIPTYILRLARQAVPKANNNTDALVVYLARVVPEVHDSPEGYKYLSDAQKDLIEETDTGLYQDMSDRMSVVRKKIELLASNDAIMKLMLYLLVGDKYGMFDTLVLGQGNLKDASLAQHVDELLKIAEWFDKESKEFARLKARRDGRPYDF